MRPIIAVTSGEPAGIGPELCLRLADFPVMRSPSSWATANCLPRGPRRSAWRFA